jgi:hypothetical protein
MEVFDGAVRDNDPEGRSLFFITVDEDLSEV